MVFQKKKTAMNGSSEYQFGKLTNDIYKSRFLEYKCKAPAGGTFSSEKDLLRMSNIDPALKETDPAAFRQAYYSGQGILDMHLTLASGSTLMVHWQYYPANLHGGLNIAQLVAERQMDINQKSGGTSEGVIHNIEIMGKSFVGISTEYKVINGDMFFVKEYFHECVNGMVKITISTTMYTFSDTQLLLESLKKY